MENQMEEMIQQVLNNALKSGRTLSYNQAKNIVLRSLELREGVEVNKDYMVEWGPRMVNLG